MGRGSKIERFTPACAVGLALGLLAAPGTARAEGLPPEQSDAEAGTRRPAAPDLRAGHFFVIGKASLVGPSGSVARGLPTEEVSQTGWSFGGIVGIGLSRYAVLEAFGSYTLLDGSCTDCDVPDGQPDPDLRARSYDAGLGFYYHLAQGIAFDPWISYGVAFRSFSFTAPDSALFLDGRGEGTYTGLDFARIAIGGDFYPVPGFGFGPFVELDLGTYVDRPEPVDPTNAGPSVHAFFQLGVRVALDPVSLFGHGPSAPSKSGAVRPLSPRPAALVGF